MDLRVGEHPRHQCVSCKKIRPRIAVPGTSKAFIDDTGRRWAWNRCSDCANPLGAKIRGTRPRTKKLSGRCCRICSKPLTVDRYFNCRSCVSEYPTEDRVWEGAMGGYNRTEGWSSEDDELTAELASDLGAPIAAESWRTTNRRGNRKGRPKMYDPSKPLTEKKCKGCEKILPIENFNRQKQQWGCGYLPRCKPCYREYERLRWHKKQAAKLAAQAVTT